MKEWGIQIASERKMRLKSSGLSDAPLWSEMALFSFPLQSGGEEMKPAPLIYVPDLKHKVLSCWTKIIGILQL